MNRREMMKAGGLVSAAAVTGFSTQALSCSAQEIENDINVVLQETSNVLAVAGQAAWAAALSKAEQALATAEQTWKSGGAAAIVTDALNAVEAVLATIPLIDPYSDVIDVLVAAIETVLALLPAPAAAAMAVRAEAPNPHKGRVNNFKSAREGAQRWNDAVIASPALHVAKIHVPLY